MRTNRAVSFIVLLGVVSLFADMTYEGARGATGPFLASLGASSLAVALIAGGGELIGYVLRLWSGRLADRTHQYWALTAAGYAINLLAVPLLALAGHWAVAAVLIVLERTGKALRTPARDAMLSYATATTGRGWGFGLHEALDQIGATIGPFLVTAAMVGTASDYRRGFAVLLVPALLALATLTAAWRMFPRPEALEPRTVVVATDGFSRRYWVYLAGTCLVAAGFADYPLIAYHFAQAGTVPLAWIPGVYGLAMGVDAIAALAFGRAFDRIGLHVVVFATVLGAAFAPLAFATAPGWAIPGMVCWGIGMGAQESVMRAAIATLAPAARRATAYGLFNLAYGIAWFAGTAVMGGLYRWSTTSVWVFSLVAQLAAVPVLWHAARAPISSES